MSNITFDVESARALLFVLDGANPRVDHESVVFIDVSSSTKTATLADPSGTDHRSITVKVEDDGSGIQDATYAVRAKSLTSLAKKVGDSANLAISLNEEKINASCGATSASLTNLEPFVVDGRKQVLSTTLTTTDGTSALNIIVAAASSAVKSKDKMGVVSISDDGQGMSIGAGSEDLYTQELLSATLLSGTKEYSIKVLGSLLSKMKKDLTKLESIDSMEIAQGHGFVTLTFKTSTDTEEPTSLKEVSYKLPTLVAPHRDFETPCDGDIAPSLEIDKSVIKSSIDSIKSVVDNPHATVTIDATQDGRVVLKVSDDESNAKNVIVEAEVLDKKMFTTSIDTLVNAITSVDTKTLNIGTVEYEGEEWIALSSEFEEDMETDNGRSDMIVAIRQREVIDK